MAKETTKTEGDTLREYVRTTGKTQEEFAQSLGMTRQNLNNYFLRAELPYDFKKELEAKGHLLFVNKLANQANPKPIYDIEGTAGALVVFQQEKPEFIEGYIDIPQFGDCDFYIKVFGNSMYPKYCNGDLVACRELKDRNIIPYGEAYLVVTKEHRMIKYIDGDDHDSKKLTLRSEHPDFKPFTIKRTDILHLYVIKGKITRNII